MLFNTDKPDILDLLGKIQEATTSDVDEERGFFKKGDRVTYNMLGGGLTDSDLVKMLGANEHAARVNHDNTLAEIVEAAGEEASRYSIEFEDGFTITDVAVSELRTPEEGGSELEIGDWIRQEDGLFRGKIVGVGTIGKKIPAYKIDIGGGKTTLLPKEQVQLWATKESHTVEVEKDKSLADHAEEWWIEQGNKIPLRNTPEWDEMYIKWHTYAFKGWPKISDIPESKTDEAEDATQTMKPQEKPDINAEDYHMEDYSEEDLNKPEAKVKSKSEKSGDAIRAVEDDELEQKEDKVVEPKNESKLEEAMKDWQCLECGYRFDKDVPRSGEMKCPKCGSYDIDVDTGTNETAKRSRGDCVFQSTHSKVKDGTDHFPINDADQARNALARANQYNSAPKWYDGSLDSLVKAVASAVKKKYTSIEVTKAAKKPGKDGKNESKLQEGNWWAQLLNSLRKDKKFQSLVTKHGVRSKEVLDYFSKKYWSHTASEESRKVALKNVFRDLKLEESKSQEEVTTEEPDVGVELTDRDKVVATYKKYRETGKSREEAVQRAAKDFEEIDALEIRKILGIAGVRESKFSFMKKQKPLWLCNECFKTFRADEHICTFCESKDVDKIGEGYGDLVGSTKEVFKVTWKNTETGKEESTRVMAFDKDAAKREAARPSREITKVEGPITSAEKGNESTVQESVGELIGEIPGLKTVDQQVLKWVINNGMLEDKWPSRESMILQLPEKDVWNEVIDYKGMEDVDIQVRYLKYVLVPKAWELYPFKKHTKRGGERVIHYYGPAFKKKKKKKRDDPRYRWGSLDPDDPSQAADWWKGDEDDGDENESKSEKGNEAPFERVLEGAELQEGVGELVGETPGIGIEDQKILRWALENEVISNEWPSMEIMIDQLTVAHHKGVIKGVGMEDPEGLDLGEIEAVYLKYVLLPKAATAYGKLVSESGIDQKKVSKEDIETLIRNELRHDSEMPKDKLFQNVLDGVRDEVRPEVEELLPEVYAYVISHFNESSVVEMEQEGIPKAGHTYHISHPGGWHWKEGDYKVTDVEYDRTLRGDLGKYFKVEGEDKWWLAELYHFEEIDDSKVDETKEVKSFQTVEIVRSQIDPDVFNIRVVELPSGATQIIDTSANKKVVIRKGKELARSLNAKFLGIVDERKVVEDYITNVYTIIWRDKREVKGAKYVSKGWYGDDENEAKRRFQNKFRSAEILKVELEKSDVNVEESKLKEQEEDIFTTVAKGIIDKADAEKLANEKDGQVIIDPDDKNKFAIIIKGK